MTIEDKARKRLYELRGMTSEAFEIKILDLLLRYESAKSAYVELAISVSFADNGDAVYVADQQLISKFDAAFD